MELIESKTQKHSKDGNRAWQKLVNKLKFIKINQIHDINWNF